MLRSMLRFVAPSVALALVLPVCAQAPRCWRPK